ncbi:MAG: sporulation protein YabP [Clostridiales bacterium]|nr:sporulation protein YabP [Clostridiales bacterium]
MEERQAPAGQQHKIILSNRSHCSLNGVTDILSFDVNEILLETRMGMLMVRGKDLHVNRLTLEKGEVDLSGEIDLLQYSDMKKGSGQGESFLHRLFR